MNEKKKEVLIVGAGPSGLMAALILARFGIPLRIIDKALNKSPYSRALAVQIRTLEIFDALGLLAKLKKKSNPVHDFEINAEGVAPIVLSPATTSSLFTYPLIVDQPHTEEVLEQSLNDAGVYVERGFELVEFCHSGDGIVATIADSSHKRSVLDYSFIIGADGAHSTVRKYMATSFVGSTYEDAFILADAKLFNVRDHHTFRIFFKGRNFLALIPMYGEHHFRLISVRRNELFHEGPKPSIDEFHKLISKLVPYPLEIGDVTWVSRFFVQCRSASHYQDGRSFIIGDAAHIHSPAGGQGMNTGLQDALNLGFKIAMVIKNLAPESLLLSYGDERKPVGEYLIKHTDRLFKLMIGGNWLIRLMRVFLLPRLMKSSELRTKFFRLISQTAIRYDEGAVVRLTTSIKIPGLCVGERIPNAALISNHLKNVDIHKIAIDHFFSCFVFIPNNIAKQKGKALYQKIVQWSHKHEGSLHPVFIFNNDFDAEKIMDEKDYFLLSEQGIYSDKSEPFFVLVRTDGHVFCFGTEDEILSADEELSHYIY